MNRGRIFIDRFSAGLDDLTIKEAGDPVVVLRILDRTKRVSVFEASANATISTTITALLKQGYLADLGGIYPWTKVALTEAGRALIDANMKDVEGNPRR